MWSVEYFSEGIGLPWLTIGVLAILVGLGIAVRFSRMRPYLGNILSPLLPGHPVPVVLGLHV